MRSRKEMERMKPWMRKTFIGIVVLFLMALLAACGGTTSQTEQSHQGHLVQQFTTQVLLHTGQAAVVYTDNGYYLAYFSYDANSAASVLQSAMKQTTALLTDDEAKLARIEVEVNTCKARPTVWVTIQTAAYKAAIKVVSVKEIDNTVKQLQATYIAPPIRVSQLTISTGPNC